MKYTYFFLRVVLPVMVLLTVAVPVSADPADCGPNPCGQGLQFCPNANDACHCISDKDICILEPLPGGPDHIAAGNNDFLAPFKAYVNHGVWQWAFGIGVAIAVLNGTFGGLQIVTSNGDSGKVDAGKARFIASAIGLVMLLLSGVILVFLNPIGFGSA